MCLRAGADEASALIYGATPLGKGLYEGDEYPDAPWVSRFDRAVETVRSRLGEDRFEACVARGSKRIQYGRR